MTDSRLDSLAVQVLVQSDQVERRLDGLGVQVLVQSDQVERRLDGLAVMVLVPVVPASPVPLGIVAAGASTTEIRALHPDGVWRVIRNRPLN